MSTIQDFIAKTNGLSFAFSNLYSVEILNPPNDSENISLLETVNLLCTSAQLPGTTINTTEKALDFRSRGKQRVYDDISLNFYCSEDMKEYIFFNNWLDRIVNPNNNRVQYHRNYARTIYINKLGKRPVNIDSSTFLNEDAEADTTFNEVVHRTILNEAYPKRIEPITLEYSASGSISTMSVTFAYTWHHHI